MWMAWKLIVFLANHRGGSANRASRPSEKERTNALLRHCLPRHRPGRGSPRLWRHCRRVSRHCEDPVLRLPRAVRAVADLRPQAAGVVATGTSTHEQTLHRSSNHVPPGGALMNINMKPIAAILAVSLAASPAFAGDKSMEQAVNDARLEGQIATAILFNEHLNPFEISVEVDNNVAVLTGTVDESIDKDLAERLAKNANGIMKVDNRIAVDSNWKPRESKEGERDFGDMVSDATVSTSVKSRLLWNDVTDGSDIKVDTNMGRVTLTGTATTANEKDVAGRVAINTDGVLSVDNRIEVTPGSVNTPTS